VLTHSLQVLLDLGLGVLDAAVDVAAFVYSPSRACQDQLVCIDVLSVEDKSARLMDSLNDLRRGRLGATAYFPTREGLRALPESVLCYSVSPSLEHVFKKYDSLYPGKASVLKGLITGDDFCFLRANWEVDPALIGAARAWEWFHKGGGYSPYYSDVHLLVAWNSDGARLKADAAKKYGSATRTIKNEAFFRKPGLGYGVVNSIGFSVKVIPKGTLFGDVGPVIQPSADSDIEFLLGFLNSELVRVLLRVRQVGERGRFAWTSNLIEQIPVPSTDNTPVKESAREITNLFQELCLTDEISPLFRGLPFVGESLESGPKNILAVSNFTLEERAARVAALESQIDLAIYESIGVCRDELTTFTARLTNSERPTSCFLAFATAHTNEFSQRFISWLLGCTFGRWDIRYATREKVAPELPDPLASLPICPPGQLQNAQGLPVSPEAVPAAYPVLIPWDGILVDDPGHPLDVETRVQQVLQVIWKERWETVEHEVCELLGVPSLRAYFCKPAGFFADHLKRYSKSRRQAPIYWPLSTAKGSYTLWIYYHRLTEQTLHTALADFVDPKLKAVRAEAFSFRESATNHTRLEKLLDLEKELEEYRAEIERIIKLPWKPNLNDGALITASPLWKLFRLPKWQKDLKACWDNLARGEHDWAHLAYSIWPKRVEDACKTDRSIAIAHDLEHLCQVEPPKAKRGKKRTTDAPEELGL
jgi:hypothetical protein